MDSIRGMQIAQYPLRWVTAPPFEGPDRAAMVGGQDVTEACERGGLVASFKSQVVESIRNMKQETRNLKLET